ncbi:sugar transferase [Streptomyces sp. NPDC088194]|uniref:sugar transferase n=1 Tax=Streptomyces sp. NPDC088194 TaxID=3154931 RepID=UPI00344C4123
MNRVNRPSTPDHSALPEAAAPPPWPETGLPPYGDAAYGDAAYGDTAYGDAGYGAGYGATAGPGAPFGDFAPSAAPAGPGQAGSGNGRTATRAARPGRTAKAAQAAQPGQTGQTAQASQTAMDPGRWQTAAADRASDADLRVVVPQPQIRPAAGTWPEPDAAPGRHPATPGRPAEPASQERPSSAERLLSPGVVLAAADCLAGLVGLCAVGPFGAPVLPAVLLCVLLAAHRRAGLYRPGLTPTALDEVPAIALGTVLGWGLAAAATAATEPRGALSWPELLDATALTGCVAVALRALVHRLHRTRARRAPAPTLVVGAPNAAEQLAATLRAHPEYGLAPVAVATPADHGGPAEHGLTAADFAALGAEPTLETASFGPAGARVDVPPHPSASPSVPLAVQDTVPVPTHGAPDASTADTGPALASIPRLAVTAAADIARVAVRDAVRHVVVVGPAGPATAEAVALLAARGCRIWQADQDGPRPGSGPGGAGRIEPAHLWGYAYRPFTDRTRQRPYGKRALDIVLAGLALTAAAPILAGCALAVRLADGPGVLFRQERIGLGGRPFTVLKFRTLRPADDHEAATLWSVAHDSRTSTVGRLLRRTSLDELPQLWNVLRGDMSMVGPRPERPFYVQKFSAELPGYQDRHRMPAGITGLAQVNGLRGDTSIPDRARFDNHYIESWSLWQDVAILVRTATSLFRFGGS